MKAIIVTLLAICAVDAAVRITTTPRKFEVREGESVKLPCSVEGLNTTVDVVVWMRGDELLSMDNDVLKEDPRIAVNVEGENYTFIISTLERFDSADYECSVSVVPKVSVTHKVQVTVPPKVKISGDPTVVVHVDEDVYIKCTGLGNPVPSMTWRRLEGRLPADASQSRYGLLHIRRAQIADSGFYECTAANGVPPDESVRVEIKVQARSADDNIVAPELKPWVTTDHAYVPVRLAEDVNITCRYGGMPSPQFDWLHNNFPIERYHRFKTAAMFAERQVNYIEMTLALYEVTENLFGDYTCRVRNKLGTVEAKIHVSGRPGPPAVILKDDGTLSWTVKSLEPITHYKVLYRMANEDTWNLEKIFHSSKSEQQGDLWEKSVPLDFLKEDTEYELQVQAQNRIGWGALANDHVEYTSPTANSTKAKSGPRIRVLKSTMSEDTKNEIVILIASTLGKFADYVNWSSYLQKLISQRYDGDWNVVVMSDGGFFLSTRKDSFLYAQTKAAPQVNFVVYRGDYLSC